MVAFIFSLLLSAAMIGVVFLVGGRRPVGKPLTWGEAFVASFWVFGIFMLIFGIVPNQWLLWADNELAWRADKLITPPWKDDPGISFLGRGQILVSYQVLRDIIATVIYVVFLGGMIWMWSWWQKRGKRAAAAPELPTSAFGRPLVKGS